MKIAETQSTNFTVGFADKSHPIWGLLKPVIMTSMVAGLLWLFAENFNGTEVKTILFTLIGSYGLESVNAKSKG